MHKAITDIPYLYYWRKVGVVKILSAQIARWQNRGASLPGSLENRSVDLQSKGRLAEKLLRY